MERLASAKIDMNKSVDTLGEGNTYKAIQVLIDVFLLNFWVLLI